MYVKQILYYVYVSVNLYSKGIREISENIRDTVKSIDWPENLQIPHIKLFSSLW